MKDKDNKYTQDDFNSVAEITVKRTKKGDKYLCEGGLFRHLVNCNDVKPSTYIKSMQRNYPNAKVIDLINKQEISLKDELSKDEQSESATIVAPKSFKAELLKGTKIKDVESRLKYYTTLCLDTIPNDHPDYVVAHRRVMNIRKQLQAQYDLEYKQEQELIAKDKHEADQYPPVELSEHLEKEDKQLNVNEMKKPNKVLNILKTGLDWTVKATLITPEVGFQVVENVGRTGKNACIRLEAEVSHALKTNYMYDEATDTYVRISKEQLISDAESRVAKIANAPIEAPKALYRKIKSLKRPSLPKVTIVKPQAELA